MSPLSCHSNASLMERLKKKKKIGEGLLLLIIGAMPSNKHVLTGEWISTGISKLVETLQRLYSYGRAVLINDFKSRVYSMSSHWVPGIDTVNQ